MTHLLLDTHAALFWWSDARKLGSAARKAIADPRVTVLVSAVSALEIATKHCLGKLGDIGDPAANFRRLTEMNGFLPLAITMEHSLHAGALAGRHRDPFDCLIAAQGLLENAIVVTRDKEIAAFGCATLW